LSLVEGGAVDSSKAGQHLLYFYISNYIADADLQRFTISSCRLSTNISQHTAKFFL
jgi:hypothetical protein